METRTHPHGTKLSASALQGVTLAERPRSQWFRIPLRLGGLLLLSSSLAAQSYTPQTPIRSYAQKLVDMEVAAHPHVLVMSLCARPQGSSRYEIVASNAPALVGTAPDAAVLRVIDKGTPLATPMAAQGYTETSVPLRDVKGKTIGALMLRSRGEGADVAGSLAEANAVRDAMQKVIPMNDTLYDRFFFAAAPSDDLAMQLLSRELVRHPDLWVLAFHCTPPGEKVNKLIGINYLKLMNEASEPSEEVLAKNGNTAVEAFPSTHRVETHVDMRDQQGALIGTLATVYLYQDDTDLATVIARTQAIRDEVARDTPSLAALLQPAR